MSKINTIGTAFESLHRCFPTNHHNAPGGHTYSAKLPVVWFK